METRVSPSTLSSYIHVAAKINIRSPVSAPLGNIVFSLLPLCSNVRSVSG